MALVSDVVNTIKSTAGYVPNSVHIVNSTADCLVYHWLELKAGKYENHATFIATSGPEILYENRTVVTSGEMKDANQNYRCAATQ